jgi:hypothetical protein
MEKTSQHPRTKIFALAALLLLAGFALRIVPWTSYKGMAYDESWYRVYLHALDRGGLSAYPEICSAYLQDGQDKETIAKVPPLRVLFVTGGYLWKRAAFGDAPPADLMAEGGPARDPALVSLHRVSTAFACIGLVVAWLFARRLFGEAEGLGVLALCACSPLILHTSQHALIDGVYGTCALLALWTLWESMQERAHGAWLAAFGVSFALLVLAKENALFPAAAIGVLMLFGKRIGFGKADRRHWLVVIVSGLFAVALICAAAGGLRTMADVYLLFIGKVQILPYAHKTGDGPWSRYLVDWMILTPATFCLALGGGFRALREDRRALGLLVFVAVSYVAMCNVRYGMNLRYTTIWDFPIRSLAVIQAGALAARFARPRLFLGAMVALLCAADVAQYRRFFVTYRLYELPTEDLLRAERILK